MADCIWERGVSRCLLTTLGLWCIIAQVVLLACMASCTVAWALYRKMRLERARESARKEGSAWGRPLVFHSPDDAPRHFRQYAYRSSCLGSAVVNSWVAFPAAGYVVMIASCYLIYTVAEGFWFPPSVQYWRDAFGSWDGIGLPWCILFTLVHVLAMVMSKLSTAIRTHSRLPAASFREATHVVIEEDDVYQLEDAGDLDETHGDAWAERLGILARMGRVYQRASARQVLPVKLDEGGARYIEYTCVRYVYDAGADSFMPQGLMECTPMEAHQRLREGGLTPEAAAQALATCGPNEIHVHVPGICEALAVEFTDFTYIFNSIGTWAYMAYSSWNIGLVWIVMIVGSGLYRALFIVRPNYRKIAEMAEIKDRCEVLRGHGWVEIEASHIAVGDIVRVEDGDGVKLPCDGLLVDGSLVVNESMLTGEPMPVAKAPLEDTRHATVTKKLNTAYAGTLSLESSGPHGGKSVIVATAVGALTTRGQLVRMVLFPASVRFKYNDQLPVVYCIIVCYMAVLTLIYVFWTDLGSAVATYLMMLCTVAMCLSPMLPVSMVMGQSVSASRLHSKQGHDIRCLQPGRIPIAGKISTMVFDKTGTITKGSMDLAAVIGVEGGRFTERVDFDPHHPECDENRALIQASVQARLRHALASCHTVRQLRDGRLVGNSVECAMVRTCGWQLGTDRVTSPSGESLEVVRRLEFDHHRMTSGAVVRTRSGELEVFVKGSYERIRQLAHPRCVPADYETVTTCCAKDNYYTLGIAAKVLPPGTPDAHLSDAPRDELEAGLEVCGLLLFRNEIKPDSAEAIARLDEGSVRSVICTGDNELTGIAIGRQSGIVTAQCCLKGDLIDGKLVWSDPDSNPSLKADPSDEGCQLAVTVGAWRHLRRHGDELDKIWRRLVVFARMKPDDKINVVKYLQSRGLVVGMAGDGGNDCGGLRAAHAGLALSDAEASMVSPFSTGRECAGSKDITLHTVPDLIREGRACLATNLATFQYFMVYCFLLTTVRTLLVVMNALSLGEWVWITIDMAIGIVMMLAMTQSKARDRLASYRPTATLLGVRTICAIAFPYLTALLAMAVAYAILWAQPWYDPLDPTKDIQIPARYWMKKGDNYDSAVGVIMLVAALVNTAYVNTYGGVFRQSIARNPGINAVYAVMMAGLAWLCLSSPNSLNCIFRVNCDTEASLACGDIPVISQYSVGGTGGCFMGPQVRVWQDHADEYWPSFLAEGIKWQPHAGGGCAPPNRTLAEVPYGSKLISSGKGFAFDKCRGPNNCWSPDFKVLMLIITTVYVVLNHLFVRFVLLGPAASELRHRQHERDRRKASAAADLHPRGAPPVGAPEERGDARPPCASSDGTLLGAAAAGGTKKLPPAGDEGPGGLPAGAHTPTAQVEV